MTTHPQPRILMCPPDYFGIEYEINPWMHKDDNADYATARQQWRDLKQVLETVGAQIELMEPVKGLPDLVFTANAALIWHDQAYLSRFRHGPRQGETPVDDQWFRANNFCTLLPPEHLDFEGAGDALFCGETLFGGYIVRSDAGAIQWLGREFDCRVIPLQLIDERYYHLDTCFCPLSPTEAIWYPPAFDEYGQLAIQAAVPTLIAVSDEEATRFACNAVVVGKHVVMNTGCPSLEAALQQLGYATHATLLDEFLKSGGSAKCLTLRLDGEEAAEWRHGK
jgi:N-dimethylarginine dimethylaminohydrolase